MTYTFFELTFMLFNSIDFALFLPIVFLLYWVIPKGLIKTQNLLLIIASYVFYGWWDWRFLLLILFSTMVDYTIGILLSKEDNSTKRKALLATSILVNIGILVFFKYSNFFIENFISAFSFFGQNIDSYSLNIILPVGISFYTFQTLSYTIDVYHRKIEPTADLIAFAAFVSFFPQLVAGPIERASNLLPQFTTARSFSSTKAIDGLRQMLWGFFKKIVIADNCAVFVTEIFNNSQSLEGSTLLIGAVLFTVQIYCDFSGYSDIAIGTSRLFGFSMMQNFAFPYFSKNIGDFWKRWHISLTSWFRDYLYIPLGGSRGSALLKTRNIFIIFLISGFWHGANWTFIVWGLLHAFFFVLFLLVKQKTLFIVDTQSRPLRIFTGGGQMLLTFTFVVLTWVFFRSKTVTQAFEYTGTIFSTSLFTAAPITSDIKFIKLVFLIIGLLIVEWQGKSRKHAIENIGSVFLPIRWLTYIIIILSLITFQGSKQDFIYFQF